jgi:formylglycine-generating enzyme required for sulfatase activity
MRSYWLAGLVGCLFGGVALCAQAADPPKSLTVDLGNGVEMKFALVPAGTFQQGSPADEAGHGADETQRQTTLTKPFYFGVYAVTRGQFAQFVKATGYRTEAEKGTSGGFGWDGKSLVQRQEFTWRHPGFSQTDSDPVTIVTFADAEAFCHWLAKKIGRTCELPTEAQWEYACRAGTTTPFYAADPAAIAWFKANAGAGTHPVGEKAANAFGLYDTSGNVFEWCRDWYGAYDAGAQTDPRQTRDNLSDKPRRVLRGGSWLREEKDCRSAARYKNAPGSRNADNGFRVVAAIDLLKPAQSPPPVIPAERPDGADIAPPPKPADRSTPVFPNEIPTSREAPRFDPNPSPPFQPGEIPQPDDGGSVLWYVVPIVALIAIAFIIFRTVFRNTGGAVEYDLPPHATPVQSQTPITGGSVQRTVDDGFWLGALGGLAGHSVRYRCLLDGQPHVGQAVVQSGPQGHFVYTGGTPTDVQILGIDPPGAIVGGDFTQPSPQPPHHVAKPTPPSQPFRGYPSAY